jgi:hypothetical protein
VTHGNAIQTLVRNRTGSSDPKWREKVRAGLNATGNLTGRFDSMTFENGHITMIETSTVSGQPTTETWDVHGLYSIPSGVAPSGSFTTADNLALKYTFRAIKDNRTSFQGMIFLGEAREAISMITNRAKSLRKGIAEYITSATSRSRAVPKKTRPKVLADTWLEYSFGWVPLVSDIAQAASAYAKHTNKVFTTRVSRQGTDSTLVSSVVNATGDNVFGIPFIRSWNIINTRSVRYLVGLRYSTKGANPNMQVFERAGLVISEFVPTVWELTPWSFLIDYFTNIGDIIEAGATNTSDVVWVCCTRRSTAERKQYEIPDMSYQMTTPTFRRTITGSPSVWTFRRKDISRFASSLTIPSFSVSVPGNPTQWINMAALKASSIR